MFTHCPYCGFLVALDAQGRPLPRCPNCAQRLREGDEDSPSEPAGHPAQPVQSVAMAAAPEPTAAAPAPAEPTATPAPAIEGPPSEPVWNAARILRLLRPSRVAEPVPVAAGTGMEADATHAAEAASDAIPETPATQASAPAPEVSAPTAFPQLPPPVHSERALPVIVARVPAHQPVPEAGAHARTDEAPVADQDAAVQGADPGTTSPHRDEHAGGAVTDAPEALPDPQDRIEAQAPAEPSPAIAATSDADSDSDSGGIQAAPAPRQPRQRTDAAQPSFARAAPSARPVSRKRRAFEAGAVLGLLLLLAVQLLVADRARLAGDARWRPLVTRACSALGCHVPAWREPSAFRVVERDVRARGPGVLRVSARIRNDARWAQPWPALQLTLSDAHGREVATRIFQPREYLGGAPTQPWLGSGQDASLSMDIIEPGPQAVAFTFEFK